MRSVLSVLVLPVAIALVACESRPFDPSESSAGPLFKPKCETPPCKDDGGTDPPPPPQGVEAHVLFSSSMGTNPGGGGCKRGDLQDSMYRLDLNGNFERVFGDNLENQAHTMDPTFSPDGTRFAMYRDVYTVAKGRCATEHFQIATASTDGTEFQVVREFDRESGRHVRMPKWSPGPVSGSERLAWLESNSTAVDIMIAQTDGSSPSVALTGNEVAGSDEIEGFEWSRTGDALLVNLRDWGAALSWLRLYDLDCSGNCAVAGFVDIPASSPIPVGAWFSDMDWARLHDWVIAPACIGGDCDLYRFDLTNRASPTVTRITAVAGGADELEPTWSPDDSKILFTAGFIDGAIWRVEMDLTVASLPWSGDLQAPGIRATARPDCCSGMDWRRF